MTKRPGIWSRPPVPGQASWGRILLAAVVFVTACGRAPAGPTGPSATPSPPSPPPLARDPVFAEVWSINAFDGRSYEFKTNCVGDFIGLESCFLWDLTSVVVTSPSGDRYALQKDFNVQAYSGEVTRRWVLYGPAGAGLPAAGEYRFLYYRGTEVALTQTASYEPAVIGHPTAITWRREDRDLVVQWTPPAGMTSSMYYKVLLFPSGGSVISSVIEWTAASARLPAIPLSSGTTGTLNVAAYFKGGYAPSQYLPFTW